MATANGAAFDELYTYDGVNRLHEMERGTLNGTQSAILSPAFTECWTQDSTANWSGYRQGTSPGSWNLVQQRSVNNVNEIVSFANSVGAAWATPAYDPAGNMTTFPKASDPTTAQTAVYDAWNRLVKVSEGANTVAAYQYDGANRRTIQQNYTSGTLTETRHGYYTTPSRWQLIEERIDTSTVPERQFVWGLRYIDDLVLRDRDTNGDGTLDERLYALQDANWNVTTITNSSGSVHERYAYSPYGAPVFLTSTFASRSSSSFDWRYLFTGRQFDTETGLHDFRRRPFSSRIGTFLTRDPLGFPDGPNTYAGWFVPSTTDPTGTDMWWSYEGANGKVCGYDIWLLTGNWCSDPSVVLDAIDAHEKYVNCWFQCEADVHRTICGKIITTTEVVTGSFSVLAARVPKEWAGMTAEQISKSDPYTSLARAIGKRIEGGGIKEHRVALVLWKNLGKG